MSTNKQVDTYGSRQGFLVGFYMYFRMHFSTLPLWLLPFTFLAIAFFIPLSNILAVTLSSEIFTSETLRTVQHTLGFTFYQATISTLVTIVLGMPSAVLFARYDFPGKSLLRSLTAIPFMLPTVVVAAAFNPNNSILQFAHSVFHLSPFILILAAHVFYNTTIVIRIVGVALSNSSPSLEATARSLGATPLQVWTRVTLPLLRPAILAASLLVFLFNFTSFGVILLLGKSQYSTLETEIYFQATRQFNLPLAACLAVIQLICTLGISMLYSKYAVRNTEYLARPIHPTRPKTTPQKIFVLGLCLLLTFYFALPLLSLPLRSLTRFQPDRAQRTEAQYGFTTDYYQELFINRRNSVFYVPPIRAILNSVVFASATVALSLLLGFPAAFALARPTQLEKYLDPLIMLPLGSSAVMLGLGFIITYGKWLASPWLVPFAHTLVALPFVIRTLQPAIASIPQRLRHAAATLGASPFEVWKAIDLPILRRATLAAATFAFTISIGEFGATLLIARPEYPTIPVAIERFLSQPGGLNYGQALAMATILMLITVAGILFLERLRTANSDF